MDIERHRREHAALLGRLAELRRCMQAGVEAQADAIAAHLAALHEILERHLAAEDAQLYPALHGSACAESVALGRRYQDEMQDIATVLRRFLARWRQATSIAATPETFRQDAETAFRALQERIEREERELYPAARRL